MFLNNIEKLYTIDDNENVIGFTPMNGGLSYLKLHPATKMEMLILGIRHIGIIRTDLSISTQAYSTIFGNNNPDYIEDQLDKIEQAYKQNIHRLTDAGKYKSFHMTKLKLNNFPNEYLDIHHWIRYDEFMKIVFKGVKL